MMNEKKATIQDVVNCAACNKNHRILFIKMRKPKKMRNSLYTHFGICPNKLEFVYMK